jgi:predicted nucleotidyltransferase
MRLSEPHRREILRVIAECCGPDARVRLFGSRLDDSRRGGDVDLLVEIPYDPEDLYALQRMLSVKLLRALGGRPVDVLIVGPHTPRHSAHEEALREGELL